MKEVSCKDVKNELHFDSTLLSHECIRNNILIIYTTVNDDIIIQVHFAANTF